MWLVICSVAVLLRSSAADTECPDNWIAFHGSCYLFGHDALHFSEAEVAQSNIDVNHFVGVSAYNWWMGLTDEEVEGTWKWYDTDTVTNITDWDISHPDPFEEDCAVCWAIFDFRWGDVPCTNNKHPICELRPTDEGSEIIG